MTDNLHAPVWLFMGEQEESFGRARIYEGSGNSVDCPPCETARDATTDRCAFSCASPLNGKCWWCGKVAT